MSIMLQRLIEMQSLAFFKSDMYMEKVGWVNPKMAATFLSRRRDSEWFSFFIVTLKILHN